MSEQMKAVLESIANRGCGVPGHAVAVGCGSNYLAQKALEGEYLKFCPDCGGQGFNWDFEKVVKGAVHPQHVPCSVCKGKQVVPLETDTDGTGRDD